MAEFKSYEQTIKIEGKFPIEISLKATNPDEEFVLLQQEQALEAQLALIRKQKAGEI